VKKTRLRAYRASALGANDRPETVFFTLPDFGNATRLFSCLTCGALFALPGEDEDYSALSLERRIGDAACPGCGDALSSSLAPYPASFRENDGSIGRFDPGPAYPPADDLVELELWDLSSLS
jgi:hypothetical protein